MGNVEIVREEVTKLLSSDDSGHGMDHINRVEKLALLISEDANNDLVSAIALLHDADDYKLFGLECSENLTNTKNILAKTSFTLDEKNIILRSIKTIGYSKRIAGITPLIKKAMIVSDADMLDAMGAVGILRSHHYNITHGNPFFDEAEFPTLGIDAEVYKKKTKGTVVNHIFEKILRLKDMMLTEKGKAEALRRYEFLVSFLSEFFDEVNAPEWQEYLKKYMNGGIK